MTQGLIPYDPRYRARPTVLARPSLWILIGLILGLVKLCGCIAVRPVPQPCQGCQEPNQPRPDPTPDPVPVPDPNLPPAVQMTQGTLVLLAQDLDKVRLSPKLDVKVLGHVTWEQEGYDLGQFVAEFVLRGTTSEPCLAAPCKGKMELQVRATRNLGWDRQLDWTPADPNLPASAPVNKRKLTATLAQSCGAGVSGPSRIPIGPLLAGTTFLLVDVDCNGLTVSTSPNGIDPYSTIRIPARVPCSYGIGRVISGAPWPRSPAQGWRAWYWDALSSEASLIWIRQDLAPGPQPRLAVCPPG